MFSYVINQQPNCDNIICNNFLVIQSTYNHFKHMWINSSKLAMRILTIEACDFKSKEEANYWLFIIGIILRCT
jgi:hypothetical protein